MANISIHALREEGDINFQLPRIPRSISIHALREEGDKTFSVFEMLLSHFYPRPPRGGRLRMPAFLFAVTAFLSTPSARRATVFLNRDFPWLLFLSTPSARRATSYSSC